MKTLLNLRTQAENAAANLPPLLAEAEKAAASILHGEHGLRRAGTGEKFWQFREYMAGDRPQDIDWRQSGRGERIYIRQKEHQTTQTSVFWCSNAQSMNFSSDKTLPTKAETAQIFTLALAILLTRGHEEIKLLGHTAKGRSSTMINKIGLSLLEGRQETLPNPAFKLPRKTNFIQVGDFISLIEDIEASFSHHAALADNGLVLQILDPAEITLPFEGRAIFEDNPKDFSETIDHVEAIRTAYEERITQHIDAVKTLCQKYGWLYILHKTDSPIAETLSAIWVQMGARP